MLGPFCFWRKLLKTKCIVLSLLILALSGCSDFASEDSIDKSSGSPEELRVVNWNVQTFFDSKKDGIEYDEFIASKTWGTESYTERLKRLSDSIKILDADVLVMEEIENEGVIHDISNFLAGEWNQKKIYRYACFAKDSGSSIGCGVLSRYPLYNMTVHAMDIRGNEVMPKMRPLIQLTVRKGNRNLTLFVNHWKSMSGGEEETEVWRLRQESVLSNRIQIAQNRGDAILACGDFNRDIMNFKNGNQRDTVLLRKNPDENCAEGVEVLSAWFDEKQNLIQPGSYYYSGEWSRIDNFFIAGTAELIEYEPKVNGPWCDSQTKVPSRYQIWNGSGYSDHLPISCLVRF